ncbi:MAG: endonuclease/exonuclease/phosphatase family protein [Bacteroidales bacterium]|nr:endonuclease/exonuclease/phosphatase family protein [Bacteroidales bacterium]
MSVVLSSSQVDAQRIAFWNVENFFDTRDDVKTNDDEFTPEGARHWNYQRFYRKRNALAKTIIAMGSPAVVGLAEVENSWVLHELTKSGPLRKLNYRVVHHDSPDKRGIDCALLYRADIVKLIEEQAVDMSDLQGDLHTRDVLRVGLCVNQHDTLYLFVCHLPSRLNGDVSDQQRGLVAERIRQQMDSVANEHPDAMVIALGDFNAEPDEVLALFPQPRYRLLMGKQALLMGSYSHQGTWMLLDNMVAVDTPRTEGLTFDVFRNEYLLQKDDKHLGSKPYRTYYGGKYNGGISDHLPIYLDLPR